MNAPSPSSIGSRLIARIWHGVTEAARADEYADYLERTGAKECRAPPGNRGVYGLRRITQHRATSAAQVYDARERVVLPHPSGDIHPGFGGWVTGTGTPVGMLAGMLASGMNPQGAEFDDSSAVVENQVIAWLVELLGLPAGTHGLLVSGGSLASLGGHPVRPHPRPGVRVPQRGPQHRAGPRPAGQPSTEHDSPARPAAHRHQP